MSAAGGSIVPESQRRYARNWSTPTSFGIWGGTPGTRTKLASVIAHRVDAEPYWLQIELASEPHDPEEYAVVDRVPSSHRFLLDPEEMAPQAGHSNVATWFLRTDVGAGERLNHLADFTRLPLLAQRLLEGRSAYSPTKALVISNANRLQGLYPQEEGGIRPFIEAINEYATTLVLTTTITPAPNARDLDYILHLTEIDRGGQKALRVTCDLGAPKNAPGLFHVDDRRDFDVILDEIGGT